MNPINEYLDFKDKGKKNTLATYKAYLKDYFKVLKTKPETYFNPNRNYEQDITTYLKAIQKRTKQTPYTKRNKINLIIKFLKHNRIIIDPLFEEDIRDNISRAKKQTADKPPTKEQLKKIISYANTLDKALFLTITTSGMRATETILLKIENIHLKENPCRITIPAKISKSGYPRTTFITNEAKESIETWLTERNNYTTQAIEKTKHLHYNKIKDNRMFPIEPVTVNKHWNKLLKKAKLDQKDDTGIRIHHEHTLKQYFMSNIDIQDKRYIDYFTAHLSQLDIKYFKPTEKQLQEQYLKGMKPLLIYTTTEDLTPIKEDIKKLQKDKNSLENISNTLIMENSLLKQKVQELSNTIDQRLHPYSTYSLETDQHKYINGKRIDYIFDKEKCTFIQVNEETQKEINKSCKDEIKYELEYIRLEKENPNLTSQEIDELITKTTKKRQNKSK